MPTAVEQPPADPSSAPLAPPTSPEAAYRSRVTQQVTDALQQSRDQLAAQLQADPQATLITLAKPLGIAQDRLAQIVLDALNDAADANGTARLWTPQEVAAEKAFWASQDQGQLIAEVSRWLRTQ
jgi:hypothetical protein